MTGFTYFAEYLNAGLYFLENGDGANVSDPLPSHKNPLNEPLVDSLTIGLKSLLL